MERNQASSTEIGPKVEAQNTSSEVLSSENDLAMKNTAAIEAAANTMTENNGKPEAKTEESPPKTKHSWQFWLVFASMCVVSFSSALDSTIITTALPTVNNQIGGQGQYVWIANSFVLASTAVQPLVGQFSDIFGRRWPMLISVGLFILGSGIGGGANSTAMLIGGRTVQGLGSGGIFVLVDLITCDLVPMRERGQYLGIMLSTAGIGTTIGPLLGGAIAQANWRWVFWINLPIAGSALVAMALFLKVKHKQEDTWVAALARIDWIGSFIFISSITAILLGLIFGGNVFPWGSYHVIVPIVLGFVGWASFHIYEASPLCKNPSMPPRLFTNRTSFVGYLLAFDAAMLLEWIVYYLPIYFQAVLSASPLVSGVNILPLNCFLIPFAIISGGLMTKFGRYRRLYACGFGAMAIGVGLFSILNSTSNRAAWVCFQIIEAFGLGFVMTTILPSIQASLQESDVAAATGAYAFLRSFGFVWGVTIPSIVFNNQFNAHINEISDSGTRALLVNGQAYGYATGGYITSLPNNVRAQVLNVYTEALKPVWEVAIGFALLGFLLVFAIRHVELRTELQTEYGLEDGKKRESDAEKVVRTGAHD